MILSSQLEPTWNYLDSLAENYSVLAPTAYSELPRVLTKLLREKRLSSEQLFGQIKSDLLSGLGEVNDDTLKSFLSEFDYVSH